MSYLWRQFAEPEFQLRLSVALGMVAFQCLVAMWAATSKRHWFWRALAVWAAVMLMVPIRAWEPAWLFGLSSPLIVALIALGRRWQSPAAPAAAAPSEQDVKNRWRFSLLDLLLLILIAGLWIHGAQTVIRHYQPRNWLGWLASSVALAALATAAYACARSPRRWPDVALLAAALIEFEAALGLGYPFMGIIAAGAALAAYGCAFNRRHWAAVLLLACALPASAAAVSSAGVWMRHLDPLHLADGAGSFWEKTQVMMVLGAEIVSVLVIVLGLVRATRSSQFWLPWRVLVGTALACVAGMALLGVGRFYVQLLQRTPPLAPVAKYDAPANHYDRIMELAREIGTIHPAAKVVKTPSLGRPDAATAAELNARYEELSALLDGHNFVPYDPNRDASEVYEVGTKWAVIRELLRSLDAEADWARESNEPGEAADFALALIRLGDVLNRGGIALDRAFGLMCCRTGYLQLAELRPDFPVDRLRATIQTLHSSLAQREERAIAEARQADYEEKAYGWGLRLEGLLTGSPQELVISDLNETWGQVDGSMNLLLQTDLAIRQFQRDTGRLPDNLDRLVPKYLSELPRDPPPELLRYRVEGDQFVLYSIGWDRHDDGGKFGRLGEYLNSNPDQSPPSIAATRPTWDFDLETWTRK